MTSREALKEARRQFEEYWKPVAPLFQGATTRTQIQEACTKAEERTGMKYCFGIGYHGDPMREAEETVEFHGWMYDTDHDMITVWYTHGPG